MTPREECRLRSIRLGTQESPGKLPPSFDDKRGETTAEIKARRDAIRAFLASGPKRACEVAKHIGKDQQTANNTLFGMNADGLVISRRDDDKVTTWRLQSGVSA
jgi:DNA-binding transcriptional ArsR family regulator